MEKYYRHKGLRRYVYLWDEMLELENIELISANMTDLLVGSITEMSYRNYAERISAMTGQSISAMGVWSGIQALGEKVCQGKQK